MFDRMISNQERHAKLMGEMMRRFGVLDADSFSLNDAICLEGCARRCMGCRSIETCERWMAAASGTAGAEAFCPNVSTFAKLAA
jgi:pyruvate-formate lyase-activating enzyme